LSAELGGSLGACAKEVTGEAVHDTRTGTRRIEAMLDVILHERGGAHASAKITRRWRALLKKIRRAAAPVRDLDVHRKLLEKLVWSKAGTTKKKATQTSKQSKDRPARLGQQAADLDAWLKNRRRRHAKRLKAQAAKWSPKAEEFYASFEATLTARTDTRGASDATGPALDAFACVAVEMPLLDGANLHEFRKGSKKARYIAESEEVSQRADADAIRRSAGASKALHTLQHAIGDWHDWLVLGEEAHRVLGDGAAELTERIEARRNRDYHLAITTTERIRRRLMAQWLMLRRHE
jgi:CHAD domain-containing protein